MAIEIKAPTFPESVADGTVATWHKQPGDAVARDENLVDLETDKVVLEVPAPTAGIVKELFNLKYVPRNIFYQFLNYPFFAKNAIEFFMGGSLFLLSPVFFLVFIPLIIEKKSIDNFILLISIILINIPIVLFMATGYVQFGSRFSMDFIVPLLLLTMKGVKYIPEKVLLLLFLISFFHFLVGFFWFVKFG